MRNRCHVLDQGYIETGRLKRAYCRFPACTGSLNVYFHLFYTHVHRFPRASLSRKLRGKRGALSAAGKTRRPGASPGYDVTGSVRDRHDRVVERSLNMSYSAGDVNRPSFALFGASVLAAFLAFCQLSSSLACRCCRHFLPGDFLLAPPTVLAGPLRVRALVLVR